MFFLVLALGVLAGWLAGGSLRSLASSPLRKQELMVAALLLQALLHRGGSTWAWLVPHASALHALSYLLLFFCLYDQTGLPGFRLLTLGIALNSIVIALNGFRMPVLVRDLAAAGQETMVERLGQSLTHTLIGPGTRLPWLGDVIHLEIAGANVMFSVGDVFLWVGIFWFVISSMKAGAVAPREHEC